jgi:hypothetical protein
LVLAVIVAVSTPPTLAMTSGSARSASDDGLPAGALPVAGVASGATGFLEMHPAAPSSAAPARVHPDAMNLAG